MRNLIIIYLITIILLPNVYVYAAPKDAELVVTDIRIEPSNPKKGDLVKLVGEIYNAGIKQTDSLASIITAAYFVDGQLLYINEINNVKPGINNKILVSSIPVWKSESGNHVMKIVVDYHNTLQDQYDSPDDNVMEKPFSIKFLKNTHLSLDVSPKYIIQEKDTTLNVLGSLIDSNTNKPLINKKIILNLQNNNFSLKTNEEGRFSFSTMINTIKLFNIDAFFEGDNDYSSTNSTSSPHLLPKNTSSMIMRIHDEKNRYNFANFPFTILVFQDSYDTMYKKIEPNSKILLDQETLLIPLPAGHEYFAEVYIDGRFLFVTDKEQLIQDNLIVTELKIRETAMIKFHVVNEQNYPINDVMVKNWIYSDYTEDGFTNWIEVLPTTISKEPYVAKIIFPNQKVAYSEPFLVFSGEKKIIDITVHEDSTSSQIPAWIKTNAGWWADGQIDDNSFIQGIQFLIQNNILKIPSVSQGTGSNEIPTWIKTNAGWWADGQIDDNSFIQGIQFLIKEGIIQIK